ncbi:hypothetical protein HELRODRAFT_188286 [Helobdella robusta]|uniref:BTB domain-containing protein n=1 Tax=Helobdella robusta TaxID=6412 RepID=T1FPU0_HELRO|nr:hypothetical protein HELRODRAFT_188286 [Helobdella robusta]ESO06175.1 hypothetical protein HELRODRAFT_188286 [Helobdella robusta]
MRKGLGDVSITTSDGAEVSCHKCVLVARMEYFRSMFASHWMELGSENICPALDTTQTEIYSPRSARSPTLLFSFRTHSEEFVDEEDDDDDLYIPNPQTTIDFIDDLDHQLLDAVDSGTFTTTAASDHGSDGYVNSMNFSHNPFCPSLTYHPDLSLSTPSSAASSNRVDFPVSNNIINKLSGNENKLRTFPA